MSNDYGPHLFDHHAALLAERAISPDVAAERGYRSVSWGKELGSRGFSPAQRRPPALLIPIRDETGEIVLHQARPDDPRATRAGKIVKYETTAGARMAVDVPVRVRERLGDPGVPLWVTEGPMKADAAVSAGLCCVGLLGVWNWRGRNEHDAAVALAFWETTALADRKVYLTFDSDVMTKRSVHAALVRLGGLLRRRRAQLAYVYLPTSDGAKVGLDDYLAAGGTVQDMVLAARSEPVEPEPETEPGGSDSEPGARPPAAPVGPAEDGAGLLDAVGTYLGRFVAYPCGHARTAAVLWLAHTHAVDAAESTPRLAHLSPEPASGKTRALEVYEVLVPHPMHAVNATPAALFRSVKDLATRPTILFDEIDTVFGPKAKENEEVRGLLNAGHRRGAVAYRCVGEGTRQKVEPFPAYAAVALAGLGDLPDTIMTRAVVIRMRRRAPHERVEPFRHRVHADEGHALRDRLAAWATLTKLAGAWPTIPDGITDRPADVWEPLLAIAEAAGGHWPGRARAACVELVRQAQSADSGSLGIRLLADLRAVFTIRDTEGNATDQRHGALTTETILEHLRAIEDAPWAELGRQRKPLDARGLARRLKPYGVGPEQYRDDTQAKQRGYLAAVLGDAWDRYLPAAQPQKSGTAGTAGTGDDPPRSAQLPLVPDTGTPPGTEPHASGTDPSGAAPDPPACTGTAQPSGTDPRPLTSDVPVVPAVPLPGHRDGAPEPVTCIGCDRPATMPIGGRCRTCHFNQPQAAS